jgi:uncharacterized membrane protein YkgB
MQMERSIKIIQIAIGIDFLWFGALKLFPGLSPAETLAAMTIEKLTLGLMAPGLSVAVLAIWEMIVGFGFITGAFERLVLRIFMLHMLLTLTPLFLFPELCFTHFPFGLTLVGQYIMKNTVFIAVGVFLCNVRIQGGVAGCCGDERM